MAKDPFLPDVTGGLVSGVGNAVSSGFDKLFNGRRYSDNQTKQVMVAHAAEITKVAAQAVISGLNVYQEHDKQETVREEMRLKTKCYETQTQQEIEANKDRTKEKIARMETWRQGSHDLLEQTKDDPETRKQVVNSMLDKLDKLSADF